MNTTREICYKVCLLAIFYTTHLAAHSAELAIFTDRPDLAYEDDDEMQPTSSPQDADQQKEVQEKNSDDNVNFYQQLFIQANINASFIKKVLQQAPARITKEWKKRKFYYLAAAGGMVSLSFLLDYALRRNRSVLGHNFEHAQRFLIKKKPPEVRDNEDIVHDVPLNTLVPTTTTAYQPDDKLDVPKKYEQKQLPHESNKPITFKSEEGFTYLVRENHPIDTTTRSVPKSQRIYKDLPSRYFIVSMEPKIIKVHGLYNNNRISHEAYVVTAFDTEKKSGADVKQVAQDVIPPFPHNANMDYQLSYWERLSFATRNAGYLKKVVEIDENNQDQPVKQIMVFVPNPHKPDQAIEITKKAIKIEQIRKNYLEPYYAYEKNIYTIQAKNWSDNDVSITLCYDSKTGKPVDSEEQLTLNNEVKVQAQPLKKYVYPSLEEQENLLKNNENITIKNGADIVRFAPNRSGEETFTTADIPPDIIGKTPLNAIYDLQEIMTKNTSENREAEKTVNDLTKQQEEEKRKLIGRDDDLIANLNTQILTSKQKIAQREAKNRTYTLIMHAIHNNHLQDHITQVIKKEEKATDYSIMVKPPYSTPEQ